MNSHAHNIDDTVGNKAKEFAAQLLNFIEITPEIHHCVSNLSSSLQKEGFHRLDLGSPWDLEQGERYFVTKNGRAIIAFFVGELEENPPQFHIIAAHGDSPGFTIKPQSDLIANGAIRLNTEPYGGMIHHSWLDRPLSLAGRVIVQKENKIQCRLVNFQRDLLVIPDVAIHQNREVNDGVKRNPQTQLLPILSLDETTGGLKKLLEETLGENTILGWDLSLYNREQGRFVGLDEEMILAPRLDDLASVYPAFRALRSCGTPRGIAMAAVFHHEEIGSMSQQGADSTFLAEVIDRIARTMHFDRDIALAHSYMLSADNAHGTHPNYSEKSDPTHDVPLNSGIVVKHHANYATDGLSSALCHALCRKAGVPSLDFACRSDLKCGSTLGNISATHVSIDTADIGLPQLAMHSACETMGTYDPFRLFSLAKTFFQTEFHKNEDEILWK